MSGSWTQEWIFDEFFFFNESNLEGKRQYNLVSKPLVWEEADLSDNSGPVLHFLGKLRQVIHIGQASISTFENEGLG